MLPPRARGYRPTGRSFRDVDFSAALIIPRVSIVRETFRLIVAADSKAYELRVALITRLQLALATSQFISHEARSF